jgi:hypothetical protein
MKKYQETVELEMAMKKAEKEKKALNEIAVVNKSKIDEATRNQAREYMKKQREKRKLETKKEVDSSFVIKQRLDELRKTTRNVISKKSKVKGLKISPPNEYYSMNNKNMKEIKVLRLKPMIGRKESPVRDEGKIEEEKIVKESEAFQESSPEKLSSPEKKAPNPVKKPVKFFREKPSIKEKSSTKENLKPREESLKLKVPNVKLSMSTINRTEIGHQNYLKPQIPFWLQDTAVQPYPYNFIWAVRKKLEAYTSADAAKKLASQKTQALMNFETPKVKQNHKKSRKFPQQN